MLASHLEKGSTLNKFSIIIFSLWCPISLEKSIRAFKTSFLNVASSFVENGCSPVMIWYRVTPSDHISALLLYFYKFMTSGAQYIRVCGIASAIRTLLKSWWVWRAASSSTFPSSPSSAVLSDWIYIDEGLTLPWMILQLWRVERPFATSHRYFRASRLEGRTELRTTDFSMSPQRPSSKRQTSVLYWYGLEAFSDQ